MRYELREGDWVRHHSHPKPIRVIGVGATIAVEYPSGEMRAFEPSELKKVTVAKVTPASKVHVHDHRHDRGLGWGERFGLLMSIVLVCLIVLVLMVLAGAGPLIL